MHIYTYFSELWCVKTATDFTDYRAVSTKHFISVFQTIFLHSNTYTLLYIHALDIDPVFTMIPGDAEDQDEG